MDFGYPWATFERTASEPAIVWCPVRLAARTASDWYSAGRLARSDGGRGGGLGRLFVDIAHLDAFRQCFPIGRCRDPISICCTANTNS